MPDREAHSEAVELESLRLERQKLALEVLLKRRELSLRRRSWLRELVSNPLTLAVAGAILTIFATIVGNYLNTQAENEQAKRKLQIDLLLKYAEADAPKQARENLNFLVGAGLLSDYPQIEDYLKDNPNASPRVSTLFGTADSGAQDVGDFDQE